MMRGFNFAGLAAAILLLALASEAKAQTPPSNSPVVNHPPVAAFGGLPEAANPQLSPNGKYYVAIENSQGRPAAVIRSADINDEPPVLIYNEKDFIVHARWAKDERVLLWLSTTGKGGSWLHRFVTSHVSILSADRHGKSPLLPIGGCSFLSAEPVISTASDQGVVDYAPDDPKTVFLTSTIVHPGDPAQVLCRVNVFNTLGWVVARGSKDTNRWIMDGAGHLIGRIDQTKNPLKDHLILTTGKDTWTEVAAIDASGGHGLDVEGVSDDAKSLVMGANSPTTGMSGLVAIGLHDGTASDMYFDPRYDVAETLLDPWTQRVVGVTVIEDRAADRYFSPEFNAIQGGLEKAFPGKTVHALSWDKSHNRLTIVVSGPRNPPAYYLFDRTLHTADLLLQTYPRISENDLGEVAPYPYKARDGLDIPAYLTLPSGKQPKNLPVVIMPHGGPMARDRLDFDWMAQFLANRGYAVLQPNFRGSTGYGTKFLEAGFGEWGLKMQDDITDGVNKLVADGIADPKRICIVGASYGGYAALAGAAFTPKLYACAASWGGVFDLEEFLSERVRDYGEDSAMISSWNHFIGGRMTDPAKLGAASPARHADKIACPILLMHGADDTTVRIEQSENMDRALHRAGKKATFVTVSGETHYMETSASRIRWLTELEKFLKENIGN